MLSPRTRRPLAAMAAALLIAAVQAQDSAAPPATEIAPEPAEPASLSAQSLLLDVVNTGKHLIAVGERGHIVASNDGERWAQVAVPARATLTALSFPDSQHGWVVGYDGVILHSRDDGRSWQLQHFQPERPPLLDVLFTDQQHGIAIGAFGLMLGTEDGGAHWTEREAPALREPGLHLNAIVRLNDGQFLIAGESGLLGVSADGLAWERLPAPYEGSFFGAVAVGEHGALVFGLRGNVYRTENVRDAAWQKIDIGSQQTLFGGTVLADGRAVLVGADGLRLIVDASGVVQAENGEGGTLSSVVGVGESLLAVGELGVNLERDIP